MTDEISIAIRRGNAAGVLGRLPSAKLSQYIKHFLYCTYVLRSL